MIFQFCSQVDTSPGAVERHSEEICSLGKKCCIVCGRSAADLSGALQDVESVLNRGNVSREIYREVPPNPSVALCKDIGERANAFRAQFLVGIGGGSALDAAKAAAVFAANPGMDEASFYSGNWAKKPLPVLLVGTTAGTGSEVTSVAVLLDNTGKKHSIHDARLFSNLSLGDPRYTMSLPRSITLSTGIDALSHCTESYFAKKANDVSESMAIRGIRMMLGPLHRVAKGEEITIEMRQILYDASIVAGLAIAVTGTVFPHSIGYYLTEHYGISHGIASARYLPALLDYEKEVSPDQYAQFFREIGILPEELTNLIHQCLPKTEIRIRPEEIDPILNRWDNGSVHNTLGDISLEKIREVFLCG